MQKSTSRCGQTSRKYMLNDSLLQGLVLAPLLFNIYASDLPSTPAKKKKKKVTSANDTALIKQPEDLDTSEKALKKI